MHNRGMEMMQILYVVLAGVAAYALGSVSFAVLVSRSMGLSDPRSYGSKNAGATNVLRSGSKKAAVVTLVLDFLKGLLPVVAVNLFGHHLGLEGGALAVVALAVVVGHCFPVFFGFKGGKGVATAAGVVFGVHWGLGLMVLAVFAALFAAKRIVSLASVLAALSAPLLYLMAERSLWYGSKPVLFALFLIAVLIVVKHGANINRLLAGEEPKFGQ
jgi:acyl phosphate:glycerol-3-phosphate acyltransferase